MKVVKLDLTDCRYADEFHERIRVAFDFPEWYGKNWDALWDMMWSECTADKVEIYGEASIRDRFADYLEKMHEIFEETIVFNQEHDWPPFSYEIMS